jgi:hypothetical protein
VAVRRVDAVAIDPEIVADLVASVAVTGRVIAVARAATAGRRARPKSKSKS